MSVLHSGCYWWVLFMTLIEVLPTNTLKLKNIYWYESIMNDKTKIKNELIDIKYLRNAQCIGHLGIK